MDLPLCKICGDRHRLGGCPKFDATSEQRKAWLKGMVSGAAKTQSPAKADQHPEAQGAPQAQQEATAQVNGQDRTRVGAVEEERPRAVAPDQGRETAGQQTGLEAGAVQPEKPTFDRKAYQRDLMRKRRAAAKLKLPAVGCGCRSERHGWASAARAFPSAPTSTNHY